jgi:hypothetical protein
MGAEPSGQQTRPILQMSFIADAHIAHKPLLVLHAKESPGEPPWGSPARDHPSRSRPSLGTSFELGQVSREVMLRDGSPSAEKQEGRAHRVPHS